MTGFSFEAVIQVTVGVGVEERESGGMLCFGVSRGPCLRFSVVLRGTVVSACLLN